MYSQRLQEARCYVLGMGEVRWLLPFPIPLPLVPLTYTARTHSQARNQDDPTSGAAQMCQTAVHRRYHTAAVCDTLSVLSADTDKAVHQTRHGLLSVVGSRK